MDNILVIAYDFPPMNVGGAIRPAKFAKYLPIYGFNPIVVTLATNSYKLSNRNLTQDKGLLDGIENVIRIEVPTDNLKSYYSSPFRRFLNTFFNHLRGNEARAWNKNFSLILPEVVKQYRPQLIFVTAPPFGIINLAIGLKRRYNLPLIIDMRDSYSGWIVNPFGSYLHYLITVLNERFWFKNADAVITVTEQIINEWKGIHRKLNTHYFVIPNGFDNVINSEPFEVNPQANFIIGYVGSFYYSPTARENMLKPWYKKKINRMIQYLPRKEDWLYRSPYFLFKVVSALFKRYPHLREKVFLSFAGERPSWFDGMVAEFELESNVTHIGWLTYDETLNFLGKCDAFLSTSVKVIDGEDYCLAGKTFDYLIFKKPILAFVTKGSQQDFIKRAGIGVICPPDDIEESVQNILQLLENTNIFKPNIDYLKQFNRKVLTQKLSEIFNETIKKHH